jgi:acetate kinase
MGAYLDAKANRAGAQIVRAASSPVTVFVVPTYEQLMIAEHTMAAALRR